MENKAHFGFLDDLKEFIHRKRLERVQEWTAQKLFETAAAEQVAYATRTNMEIDARRDSHFPRSLVGEVVFSNPRCTLIRGERYVTLVEHDGNAPTVGELVELGWTSSPHSSNISQDKPTFHCQPYSVFLERGHTIATSTQDVTLPHVHQANTNRGRASGR